MQQTSLTEYLLSIFSRLRNPQTAQEADAELTRIDQFSESIPSLFEIFENSPDIIIKQYSLHTISMCIRQQSATMPIELLQAYRKKLLFYITKSENYETLDTILSVVSTSIQYSNVYWSELDTFAIQIKDHIYVSLSIFDLLIFTMSTPTVIERLPLFVNLILLGLQSKQFPEVSISVTFLYHLAPNMHRDTQIFDQFMGPLLNVFLETINSNNINFLTPILNNISTGIQKSFFIFPLFEALPSIITVLSSSSFDTSFKLQLHNFLVHSLTYMHTQFPLTIENLNVFYQLEQNICIVYFHSDDIDDMTWLVEIEIMLSLIFTRMDTTVIQGFVFTNIQKYLESNLQELISFGYLVLENALLTSNTLFEANLDQIFEIFMKGFIEKNTLKQRIAAHCFDNLSHIFRRQINQNILQIRDAVLMYTNDIDVYLGTSLLCKVIKQVENTDIIFTDSILTAQNLFSHSDLQIKIFALNLISLVIENSLYQSVLLFDNLYKTLFDILSSPLSFESPYSIIYESIAALSRRAPQKMLPHLPEIIPYLIEGFNSSDAYGAIEIIKCFISIFKIMKNQMNNFLEGIFNSLYKRVNKNWTEELICINPTDKEFESVTFHADSLALQALAKITKYLGNQDLVNMIFNQIMNLAGLFSLSYCIVPTMKAFKSIIFLLQPDPLLINLLQQCYNFLMSCNDHEIFIVILKAITYSLIKFGVEVFSTENCENLVKKLLSIITTNQNVNLYDSKLFNQIQFSLPIITKQTCSELFINEVFAYFIQLFKTPNFQNADYFSLEIITTFVTEMPEFFLQQESLKEIIPNLNYTIINGNIKIATSASSFILNVTLHLNEQIKFLFIPFVNDFFNSLNLRLINEQNNHSILTETIVAALAILGNCIIKEQFPFDKLLNLMVNALPIVEDIGLCYYVYAFLTCNFDKMENETKIKYLKMFIILLAQPYSNVLEMKIGLETWKVIIGLLKQLFNNEAILNMLNGDEKKFSFFMDSVQEIISEFSAIDK